uniref:Patatin n=1 Tax=Micromonas pusilla TaxID=38833 RepID=A0A7S0IGJ9_MICPS|mmetsp:Transcript_5922/g.24448  ORF Transcript_5922/g.24448 Transcript_5922/m.24448 type:complete len:1345 (+) Transcript_5922:202-4236(+)
MASFFGMGRAPHQLSLRVTYEGYAKNPEDPDAPIPREGTLAVDWEAAEETSAVLERIDAQMRTLPFNHKGQVVALRLDVDDRAGSASNASASPNGGSAGNGANGVGAHQRTSSGNLLKDVFGAGGLTSFLLGGGDDFEAAPADPPKPPKLPPSTSAEGRGASKPPVRAELVVEECRPRPVRVEVRAANAGGASVPASARAALDGLDLTAVHTLALGEGCHALVVDLKDRLKSVRTLDLSGGGLVAVPEEAFALGPRVRELILDDNKLTSLPSLTRMPKLRRLSAENNQLRELRGDLRECAELREVSLEGNKLTRPALDMKALHNLEILRLFDNPVEHLPEMHHAHELRTLTLFNVRISADRDMREVEVTSEDIPSTLTAAFGGARDERAYSMFFSLVFRQSSCQHPLLAKAIALIARKKRANCEAICNTEGGLQQLLAMVLSADVLVVREASMALATLGSYPELARKLVDAKAQQRILAMLGDAKPTVQICGLQILSALAFASDRIAREVFGETLLDRLIRLTREGDSHAVQVNALEAMGNLSFNAANRRVVAKYARSLLSTLALPAAPASASSRAGTPMQSPAKARHPAWGAPVESRGSAAPTHPEVKRMACRALAILGENRLVQQAIGHRTPPGRGVRVLCMDGGGIRGTATVQMLNRLERGTGRKVHELFDLICGTSTGGMLAVGVGIHKHELDRVTQMYADLGSRIFSKMRSSGSDEQQSYSKALRDRLDSLYTSGQQAIRVGVTGSKHDPTLFESLVRQECRLPTPLDPTRPHEPALIDTGLVPGPKVFVVATLVSVNPASPYVFRNYEYPAGMEDAAGGGASASAADDDDDDATYFEDTTRTMGSCKHLLWQGVRASSAAPYYLADYGIGDERWQDGAVTCNNPSMLAMMEARRLWPDRPIDVVVSLGTGIVPAKRRETSGLLNATMTATSMRVLMDSACEVDRTDAALRTLLPMIPGTKYFRFNPVDERCDVELDETEAGLLQGLTDATDEYVLRNDAGFAECCAALRVGSGDVDGDMDGDMDGDVDASAVAIQGSEMGSRRGMLLVEAPRVAGEMDASSRSVREFCETRSIPFERVDTAAATHAAGGGDKGRKGPGLVALLRAATRFASQMGVIHFNCLADAEGVTLRWAEEMIAVAEPSAAATDFLSRSRAKRGTLAELCARDARVEVDGALHTVLGKHVQREHGVGGGEVGAYLFRRASPGERLGAGEASGLLAVWRDKIVVSHAALPADLIATILDADAKVVLAPLLDNDDDDEGDDDGRHERRGGMWVSDAVDFFNAFYHALYVVGADAVAALGAAALVQPSCHRFRCHMKINGEILSLQAGDDDRLDEEEY